MIQRREKTVCTSTWKVFAFCVLSTWENKCVVKACTICNQAVAEQDNQSLNTRFTLQLHPVLKAVLLVLGTGAPMTKLSVSVCYGHLNSADTIWQEAPELPNVRNNTCRYVLPEHSTSVTTSRTICHPPPNVNVSEGRILLEHPSCARHSGQGLTSEGFSDIRLGEQCFTGSGS